MPVEIRELLIQTKIVVGARPGADAPNAEHMAQLKKQVVQECLKVLRDRTARKMSER
jgi:hypothetical protein